ncbi:MAG: hypothetical protein H3C28_15240, partial [Sphingomonadales bacterium]|nr:hypothetical protein [Sphingomonadales bacterium]
WAYTAGSVAIGKNPALQLLTYLIGWKIDGKLAWGMGVPATRINFASFITYANLCEESVALLAGGTVQRYESSLIDSTASPHEAIIAALEAAMGTAKLTDVDGLYQLVGGFDDTAGPKIAFSADDLMGPYQWTPSPPSRERFNVARGRFPDPVKLYQLNDWPEVAVDPLADGIPRTRALDFAAVPRAETCQRIVKQMLLRNQYPGQFVGVFGPRAFLCAVGSLVTISLPDEGWNNKLFRVADQTESHDLVFQMTLVEEAAAIYAWDKEEKPMPADISPPGYDPTATRTPAAFDADVRQVAGPNSATIFYIDVTWTAETSEVVAGIEIQAKPSTDAVYTALTEGLFDAAVGVFTVTAGESGVMLDVRGRYRMLSGVYGAWATTSVVIPAAPNIAAGFVGQGDLATQDVAAPTIALQINKAFSSGAATALASDSGEAVLHGFNADGTEAPGVDPAVWWEGRKLTVRRYEEDGHLVTLLTSLAAKRGFIAYSIGDDNFPMNGATTFNQLTYSEEFNNAVWSKSNVTVTPNAALNHLGLLTADKIEATTSAATSLSRVVSAAGSATGGAYSIYVKKGSGATDANRFYLHNETTATNLFGISLNYDTGEITYLQGGSGGYLAAAEDVGNGWWRIKLTASAGINTSDDLRVYVGFAGNSETAGEYCYADRAMLQVGSTVGGYQMRWAAGATRRIAFVYKSGAQWYYDNNTATPVAFTPNANILALGWLETGSADTISGGGLFGHPVNLLQAALPAADVTSENTSADTSTVSGVPAKQILLSQTEIFETFANYSGVSEIPWTISGSANVSLVTTTDSGGKALRCGDNSGNDGVTAYCNQALDFAPEDLYKVEVDAEIEASSGGVMYFGVRAEDNTGANLGSHRGTYHYQAGNALAETTVGRKTYVGYIRGHVGAGSSSGYPAASPDDPKPAANNTVRLKPLFIVNHSGQAGQVVIHSFRLRKVIDATPNYRGTWSSSVTYYKDDAVDYQGRRFMALVKHTNTTPPTSETSTSTWLYIGLQPGEAGADITGGHTAAAISGQGALATKNAVDLATSEVLNKIAANVGAESAVHRDTTAPGDTTKLWLDTSVTPNVLKRYSGGSWIKATPTDALEIAETAARKWAAESGADVTGSHTASAIAGQGALATKNAVAWGSDISGRPTELTDGRISAGLSATGQVNAGKTVTDSLADLSTYAFGAYFSTINHRRSTATYGTWYDIDNQSTNVCKTSVTTGSSGTQRVHLTLNLTTDGDGGDQDNVSFRIIRDNTTPLSQEYYNIQVDTARKTITLVFYDDSVSASTTYEYKAQFMPIASDGWPTWYNAALTAVVYKK